MTIPQITLNLKECETGHKLAFEHLSLEHTIGVLQPLKEAIMRVHVNYSKETTAANRKLFNTFINKPIDTLKAEQLRLIYYIFIQSADNVFTVVKNAAPDYLKVWEAILRKYELTLEEVTEILGHQPYFFWNGFGTVVNVLMHGIDLPQNYLSPIHNGRFIWPVPKVQLRAVFYKWEGRDRAFKYFLPDEEWGHLEAIDTLPDNVETKDYGSQIASNLYQLYKLSLGNLFPPKPFSLNRLKKLSEPLCLPPFGAGQNNLELSPGALLVSAYSAFHEYNKTLSPDVALNLRSTKDFVRFVVNKLPAMITGSYLAPFLPKFTGFSNFWPITKFDLLIDALISIIKEHPNQWIDTANISDKLYRILPEKYRGKLFIQYYKVLDERSLKRANKSDDQGKVNYWPEAVLAFAVAYLRLLHVCGILEVNTKADGGDGFGGRHLQGVNFIKLTQLGHYAFGYTDDYDETLSDADDDVELSLNVSQEDTIIRVPYSDSPYVPILKKIGIQLSPIEYKITATSIIQNSKNSEDAQKRMDEIRQTFCPHPPQVWQQMFDDVNRRLHCIINPNFFTYHKIEFDPTIPGLKDFISNNFTSEEGFYIFGSFILTTRVDFFKDELRKAGYMP